MSATAEERDGWGLAAMSATAEEAVTGRQGR